MLYILLNIAANAGVVTLLREAGRRGPGLLPVVVANYWVCSALGAALTPDLRDSLVGAPAGVYALGLGLGFAFIVVFLAVGAGAERLGVGYTGMASKISVAIPVAFSHFFLNEAISSRRWWGLALAPAAVVLLHADHLGRRRELSRGAWLVAAVIF
ncbi:MAG: hypothetical protein NZ534_05615, partial [Bacteroidia bacterium]|nr:hypothetical protein [Bacteroidia bacterium]